MVVALPKGEAKAEVELVVGAVVDVVAEGTTAVAPKLPKPVAPKELVPDGAVEPKPPKPEVEGVVVDAAPKLEPAAGVDPNPPKPVEGVVEEG